MHTGSNPQSFYTSPFLTAPLKNSSCNKLVSAVLIIYVWKVPNLVFIYTHTNAIALKEVNPSSCVDGCLPSWYAVTAVEEYIVLTL